MLVDVVVGVRVGVIVNVTEGVTVGVCVQVGSGVVVVAVWAAVGLALEVGELQVGSRKEIANKKIIFNTRLVGDGLGRTTMISPGKMR